MTGARMIAVVRNVGAGLIASLLSLAYMCQPSMTCLVLFMQ